jgi:hypothetical protein
LIMRQNKEGSTSAPTLPSRGSNIPQKETKMNEHGYNTAAAAAPVQTTRRQMITAIAAAGSAATLPAVALAEASGKTSRLPQHPEHQEHPWDKARRLAGELAAVLNDADEGRWFARIYPSKHPEYCEFPIMFGDIDADTRWKRQCAPELLRLIDAHKAALYAFDRATDPVDRVRIGREPSKAAWRRFKKASKAEDAALDRVLSYVPFNDVSRAAKVEYVSRFCEYGRLGDAQIKTLLWSMCGSRSV